MKKYYILITFFILNCLIFSNNSSNVFGLALNSKQNNHYKINIELNNLITNKVYKTKTVYNGMFYYTGIPKGIYSVKANSTLIYKKIEINNNNYKIPKFYIKTKLKSYQLYLFSYFILFLVIIINIILMFFIIKKPNIKKKKYLLASLFLFSTFISSEFIMFVIGFFNEYIASKFWSISHIGIMLGISLLFKYFTTFPVKRKEKSFKIIFIISLFLQTCIIIILNSWIFIENDIKFKKIWFFSPKNYIFIYQIIIFILASLIIYILFTNKFKECTYEKKRVSDFLLRGLSGIAVFFILTIFLFYIFTINEPFKGYFNMMISIIDISFYLIILIGIFNFKYFKNFNMIFNILVETYKYTALFILYFLFANYIDFTIITSLFLVLSLKVTIDYLTFLLIKKNDIKYDKIIRRLTVTPNLKDFKETLEKDLEKKLNINKISLLLNTENNNIFDDIDSNINIINNDYISSKFCNYSNNELGLILKIDKKILGIIFIDYKNNNKYINISEMEFLLHISKSISILLNNMMMLEIKNEISNNSNIKTNDFYDEFIMYNKELIGLILKKSKNNEVKNICNIILDESNKLRGNKYEK